MTDASVVKTGTDLPDTCETNRHKELEGIITLIGHLLEAHREEDPPKKVCLPHEVVKKCAVEKNVVLDGKTKHGTGALSGAHGRGSDGADILNVPVEPNLDGIAMTHVVREDYG